MTYNTITASYSPRIAALKNTRKPSHNAAGSMDNTTISDTDLQRLNEKDKSELRSILNNEAQKSRVQSST